MSEIICPKCGTQFEIDEADYANLLAQVRDKAFAEQLHERMEQAELAKKSELELVKVKAEQDAQTELSKKDALIAELKAKAEAVETEKKLAVAQALADVEKERDQLKMDIQLQKSQKELEEANLKEKFKGELALKDEQISYYKDLKAKLSTKMVGETLEQHCEIEFNSIRAAAFPKAIFGKDNDASDGTKGDYVFREMTEAGAEVISIMFEMKNETDDAKSSKQKIESFLTKLDKDRQQKKCEYAVLVTLLEPENELYNRGIVDVSHIHPKMYVIRPQFFIPLISLLRNAALTNIGIKNELAIAKDQDRDISDFEEKLEKLKNDSLYNFDKATKFFNEAITNIDKSISDMQKVKEKLQDSANQLRLGNDKVQAITVRKLTTNNKTMKAKFDSLPKKN